MNTEDIYDQKRTRIGKIVTQSDGNQDIYDVRGTRLGQFRKNENRTYDARGTAMGFGNQLMRLLNS